MDAKYPHAGSGYPRVEQIALKLRKLMMGEVQKPLQPIYWIVNEYSMNQLRIVAIIS